MSKRNIMYISISIICIISIILGVYYQIFADKVVGEGDVNEIDEKEYADVDNPEDLLLEFNKLFENKLNKQGNDVGSVTKITGLEDKDIVYTAYDYADEDEDKYVIDLKLPVVNIDGEIAAGYNNITQSIFVNKANAILIDCKVYTIYNVEYTAYVNENILSVVIKSTLKEGNNAQRIIVQTYNYDLNTGNKITFNELLAKYEIANKDINKKIEAQVKEASKQSEAISQATGQVVYKRDLANAMYITDNVTNFFIGKDGQIYIIYAYGNNNITSEIDIIKL